MLRIDLLDLLFLCKNVRFVMERREFKYSIIRY